MNQNHQICQTDTETVTCNKEMFLSVRFKKVYSIKEGTLVVSVADIDTADYKSYSTNILHCKREKAPAVPVQNS
jgi:hypothetical protein